MRPRRGADRRALSRALSIDRGDVLLFIALLAAVALLVATYLSHERAYYWSDYANYQRLTQAKIAEAKATPLRAVYTIWRAMGDDYGQLPVLPLIAPTLILGDSRSVYVQSLALLYLVPLALIYGAIAASIVRRRQRTAFWLAAWATVGTPALTLSILRGYPDAGGAALIGMATLLFIRQGGDERSWRTYGAGGAGVLIAVAVLFRRPFGYDAVAFAIAAAIAVTAGAIGGAHGTGRQRLGCLVALLAGTAITFVTVGTAFVMRVLTEHFGALYASYEVPPLEGLAFYAAAFGLAAWLAAVGGFVAATGAGIARARPALFVAASSLLTLAIWVAIPRQLGEHYPLHFGAFVVVGLSVLGVTLIDRLRHGTRAVVLAIGAGVLGVNLLVGLGALNATADTTEPARFHARAFLAAASPPLRHRDYDGIARLVAALRRIAGSERKIYVAASSDVIGCSLLASADRTVPGDAGRLRILPCIHIDSRDEYPVEKLLWADVVLVARPVQYHLAPDQQRLVRSVVDAFTEGWPIAGDFRERAERLPLVDGEIEVQIYDRVRPTSAATAIRTLHRFAATIGGMPGGQKPWIAFDPEPTRRVGCDRLQRAIGVGVRLSADGGGRSEMFLSIDELTDPSWLRGRIASDCAAAGLRASALDDDGSELARLELISDPEGSIGVQLPEGTRHVLLVRVDDRNLDCTVTIEDLRFE